MKQWISSNRGFLIFLMCLGVFRTAIADWNPVPSGSMRPTILEGDVVLVNRLAYDFKFPLTDVSLAKTGEPQRGDIVTFSSPKDGTRLIKRLVAVPGDTVEMKDEVLFINQQPAQYSELTVAAEPMGAGYQIASTHATERISGSSRAVQFLPSIEAKRNFGPLVVPQDQYFMLGDNRDNSADSRYIGFVPRKLLIGQAQHVLVSANITDTWMPRLARFGSTLQ